MLLGLVSSEVSLLGPLVSSDCYFKKYCRLSGLNNKYLFLRALGALVS